MYGEDTIQLFITISEYFILNQVKTEPLYCSPNKIIRSWEAWAQISLSTTPLPLNSLSGAQCKLSPLDGASVGVDSWYSIYYVDGASVGVDTTSKVSLC